MPDTDNSFAAKLNRLFEEKRKPDGTFYSKKDVIDSSPVLTRVYLWRLQTGKVSKPNYEAVKALADCFGVSPDYFFEGDEIEKDPGKGDQREDLQVILRSYGLGVAEEQAVLLMIEALKKSKI